MNKTFDRRKGSSAERLREPLAELSRFAFDWAETLRDDAHGCASYHKMWSLVRLLEAGGALPSGEEFFDRELAQAGRDGQATVLLSGAADTGLMTLAFNALNKARLTPNIIMVDRCTTPLEQARLFAMSAGINLKTIRGTLDEVHERGVDAIMGHSFLSFIPADDRLGLFASWSRALRPGGRVLLSQRLTPAGEKYNRERPPEQIAERRRKLAAVLETTNPVDGVAIDILDAAEALWTSEMAGQTVTAQMIGDLAAAAGLTVESISYDQNGTSVSPFTVAAQAIKRPRAEIVLTHLREA